MDGVRLAVRDGKGDGGAEALGDREAGPARDALPVPLALLLPVPLGVILAVILEVALAVTLAVRVTSVAAPAPPQVLGVALVAGVRLGLRAGLFEDDGVACPELVGRTLMTGASGRQSALVTTRLPWLTSGMPPTGSSTSPEGPLYPAPTQVLMGG